MGLIPDVLGMSRNSSVNEGSQSWIRHLLPLKKPDKLISGPYLSAAVHVEFRVFDPVDRDAFAG